MAQRWAVVLYHRITIGPSDASAGDTIPTLVNFGYGHYGIEGYLGNVRLVPYATPAYIAFGLCAIPAGWLADKWSRERMMVTEGIERMACRIWQTKEIV